MNGDKIAGIWINDDQVLWKKNSEAYGKSKNGVIYKDHPLVQKSDYFIRTILLWM